MLPYALPIAPAANSPTPHIGLFLTAEEPKTFSMAPFQMLGTQIKWGVTKDKEPHMKIGIDWLVASSPAASGLSKGAATKGGDFPAPHQSGLMSPPYGELGGLCRRPCLVGRKGPVPWSLPQQKAMKDLRIGTPIYSSCLMTLRLSVPVLMISETWGHTPLQVESQWGCEHEVCVAQLPSLWSCKRVPIQY